MARTKRPVASKTETPYPEAESGASGAVESRAMCAIVCHLDSLGISATLPAEHRSNVAVNFRLPARLPYPEFARRMLREGYYLLYGPPGDDGQFQVSTIGDLDDAHVAGLMGALRRVLTGND